MTKIDVTSKETILTSLKDIVSNNKVVLFMKGTKDMPSCGFSAGVCSILKDHLKIDFVDVNVLDNDLVRSTLKEFSNWPTFPQLYVNGELIGGYDIVSDMFEKGSLKDIF